MLQTFFDSLGFNEKEVSIYMYLLSHGPQVASTIAKKVDIKRSSIYTMLQSMVDRGLLVDYNKNKLTYFKGVEPEDITLLCERKEQELKKLKKNSMKIQLDLEKLKENQVQEQFDLAGKITYYEGIDAVTTLIEETIQEKGKEQLCFGLNEYHSKIHPEDWSNYTQKRVDNKISVKSIQPDTEAAKAYASRDAKELRTTKLVPNEDYPANCEINIMGDMIALFTTKGKKPSGMKMKNKYMADTLRSLFLLAWDNTKKK
ncbi:MAG: helix-turn-helix domain-containing protein [Candidatus Peribacteria bacterium]|nr:MAG: helix-turn-helix domain-containing protein [Candidatus Peribacteria bacterium]